MRVSSIQGNARLVEEVDRGKAKPIAAFLTTDDIATLTGRKLKSLQVQALRQMGIPFFINAIGRPVVARSTVEGKAPAVPQDKPAWVPPGMRRN